MFSSSFFSLAEAMGCASQRRLRWKVRWLFVSMLQLPCPSVPFSLAPIDWIWFKMLPFTLFNFSSRVYSVFHCATRCKCSQREESDSH
uniref:Uncharacterized protein n=1 Tax=Arundo donax TaxID=35708 RepID=A0A0A9ETE3_ARUDO